MNQFSDLSLSPVLKSNLAQNGFVTPTPVQSESIPPALAGRDVVATANTGTGKTLAFVLPTLEALTRQPLPKGVTAVILSPTRELAIQINETFLKLAQGTGLRASVVVGGLNEQRQLQHIRKGAQVLIATPGRLCDFLQRKLVKLSGARLLVVDEADRMLDMGFQPALELILGAMPEQRQTLFFSATIEKSVAHLVARHVKEPVRVAVGEISRPAHTVDLHVYEVESDQKLSLLRRMLSEHTGSFLVFSRTRHGADRLARKLAHNGVKATSIHGDRTQSQRNQALRGFQDGQYRVLVATDVAARGIHVEDIAHVVNFDLPQAPEDFIHRVGRTGRAGGTGIASTFSTRAERNEIRKIERALQVHLKRQPVDPGLEREPRGEARPHSATVIELPVRNRAPKGNMRFAARRRAQAR